MSKSDEAWPVVGESAAVAAPAATVVSHHEEVDGMGSRSMTVSRYEEIRRRLADPLWMRQLEWSSITHDLGLGYELKSLWEEKAQQLTGYSNFWKQFYRKFPQYREASVTAREFEPGE